MTNWIYIITLASNIPGLGVLADTTSSFSASCLVGSQQTAFPSCNHFLNFGNTCPNLPTDEAWKECLCNQDYINSLFGCESEVRLCLGNDAEDVNYEEALSAWHSLCNTFLPSSLTITTPPLSTITATFVDNCPAEAQACETANLIYENCGISFTNFGAAFTSCYCQPTWLSLDYQCEYVGNTSCAGIPATLSALVGYDCPNFQQVIGTGLPTTGSVVTVSRTGTTSDVQATPSPSRAVPTASQTATAKASEAFRVNCFSLLMPIFSATLVSFLVL